MTWPKSQPKALWWRLGFGPQKVVKRKGSPYFREIYIGWWNSLIWPEAMFLILVLHFRECKQNKSPYRNVLGKGCQDQEVLRKRELRHLRHIWLEAIGSYVKAMMVGIFWRQRPEFLEWLAQKIAYMGEHLHLCFFSKVSIFATCFQCFYHSRASLMRGRRACGALQYTRCLGQIWSLPFESTLTTPDVVNETFREEDCLGIHLGLALFSSQLDLIVDLTWKTCITWCFWCGVTPTPKKIPERFNFHQCTQNLLLLIP